MVDRIEATGFDKAGRKAEGHARIVGPLTGLETEGTTADHIVDRSKGARTPELQCSAERIADRETQQGGFVFVHGGDFTTKAQRHQENSR